MPQTPAVTLIRLWRDITRETAFQAFVAAPLAFLGALWPARQQEES